MVPSSTHPRKTYLQEQSLTRILLSHPGLVRACPHYQSAMVIQFGGPCTPLLVLSMYNGILPLVPSLMGERDCPYRICYPWVPRGRDLEAPGKFFRRSRRLRRRRLKGVSISMSTSSTREVVLHPSHKLDEHLEHVGSCPSLQAQIRRAP